MKYNGLSLPNNVLQNIRLASMGGLLVFSLLASSSSFAQNNLNLVPGDDAGAVNQVAPLDEAGALPLEDDNKGQSVAKGGNAKAKTVTDSADVKVSDRDASANDLLPDDGLAPKVEGGKDEFSFDDNVQYEKSSDDVAAGFRKQAFDSALEKVLPLKPEEIRSVLEHYDRTVQSTEVPVHPYPRPELTVQNVALDPGSPPLVVKLAYGYVTTLSILDQSGAPWPIEDISWVGDFEIHEGADNQTTHMLRISPSSNFAHGNISMRLLGLDTPVIITFETNRDIVHYRFDAVIPKEGPNTKTPLIDSGPASNLTLSAGDVDMSQALGGVIPEDAKRLAVTGADGRTTAYTYNGLTYVRTPLTLLSPGWESSVASADGTRVYALQDSPVLILSDKGRMIRAHLKEVGGGLDE